MATQIQATDKQAMNELMRGELTALGSKTASEDKSLQAFKDHEEMLETLNSVLADDKTETFDPNDEILD